MPGQTTTLDASQTIDLDNVPLNGGVLVKTLVLSLEPYILAGMKPVSLSLLPIMFKDDLAYISGTEWVSNRTTVMALLYKRVSCH